MFVFRVVILFLDPILCVCMYRLKIHGEIVGEGLR